jgi:hypothetical protein
VRDAQSNSKNYASSGRQFIVGTHLRLFLQQTTARNGSDNSTETSVCCCHGHTHCLRQSYQPNNRTITRDKAAPFKRLLPPPRCNRAAPNAPGGLPASDANFDDIARLNRSLSLAELGRFVLVMFPREHSAFTWNDLSWVATKAKTEPISHQNWHGDTDTDPQQVPPGLPAP